MPTLKKQINSRHRGKVACWIWMYLLYRNTSGVNTRGRMLVSEHGPDCTYGRSPSSWLFTKQVARKRIP